MPDAPERPNAEIDAALVRRLAALAGLPLAPERVEAVAAALAASQPGRRALADYVDAHASPDIPPLAGVGAGTRA